MKKFNAGIALLKIWMIYEVLVFHCWTTDDPTGGLTFFVFDARLLAVPVFFMIAAYFGGTKVFSGEGFKKRSIRLLVPHIFWSVFFFVALIVFDKIFSTEYIHGISDLGLELVTGGADYNVPLWFTVDLFLLTAVYLAIGKVIKNDTVKIIIYSALGITGIAMQYAEVMVNALLGQSEAVSYMLGRIPEMLPFMSIGIIFAHFDVLNKLKKRWYITAIICALVFVANYIYTFVPLVRHFWYGGLRTLILSLSLFVFFYVLPFDGISDKAKEIIAKLSAPVMGVYYIHYPIAEIFKDMIIPEDFAYNHVFIVITLVFVICYAISFLISLIPNSFVKKLVT